MVLADSRRISRVPRYSGYCVGSKFNLCTGLSPSMIQLSRRFHFKFTVHIHSPTTLRWPKPPEFELFPFRSPLLGESHCFLFLRVLRCFSSPGWHSLRNNLSSIDWVSPFGNPRMEGYLHLPVAYRSLSRPSSPLRAKASTIRS